jgi:hypothetical protein
MKHIPRLLFAYVVGVVVFVALMYLFDGDAMDWKKSLIQAAVVIPIAHCHRFLLREEKRKPLASLRLRVNPS